MKKLILAATALAVLPAAAMAQDTGMEMDGYGPQRGDWEITLSGSGTSSKDFDANAIGIQGSAGMYVWDNVLVGLRQSVSWADPDDGDNVTQGGTRVFADYVFDLGQWRPYVGASFGGVYGENVNDSFAAGPELGVKYYADRNTFVYAQTEYLFTFNDSDLDNAFDDGSFFHAIGVGFNF